jgi:cytochrome c-type protein NapC
VGSRQIIAVILLSGVIVLSIPFVVTVNPSFCRKCHEMEPYYKSWKRSAHGRVGISCASCHVKPKILAAIAFRFNFYTNIFSTVVGIRLKPMGISPATTSMCRRCHSLNRMRSTSGDLKINHKTHVVKAKLGCQKCHAGAVHKGVGGRKFNPPRKLCERCHKAEMENCNFCHVIRGRGLPPYEHSKSYFPHIAKIIFY